MSPSDFTLYCRLGPELRLEIAAALPPEHGQSDAGEFTIARHPSLGAVLAFRGDLVATAADDEARTQTLVHPGLLALGDASQALVLAVAPGGYLREVLRHPGIQLARAVCPDPGLVRAIRGHFPGHEALREDGPRTAITWMAPGAFVAQHEGVYDFIVCDLAGLDHEKAFDATGDLWVGLKRLLAPKGVAAVALGLLPATGARLAGVFQAACAVFPAAEPAWAVLPATGLCLMLLLVSPNPGFRIPAADIINPAVEAALGVGLSAYDGDTHEAMFSLPLVVRRLLSV